MPAVIRGALVVLALVACGSKKPPPVNDDQKPLYDDESEDRVARQPIPKAPPRVCLASYAAAAAKGACEVEYSCSYPEGTCVCAGPSHCPGANLRGPSGPLTWQCSPPPPEIRADGCPGTQPTGNKPCKEDGKECRYDICCVHYVTCQNGEWQETRHECPP